MKIDIIERNGYAVSQRLDRILREKLERLEKYFDDEVNVKVVCLKVAKQEKLEITITSKGLLYRAEVQSDNMYDNIDIALPKLEKQIVRNNEKRKEKKAKAQNKKTSCLSNFWRRSQKSCLPSTKERLLTLTQC